MRTEILLLAAALIWGSAAWVRAPQRQQELRVLITARNMVEAGDPLHFEFQNQPRYRKPPLAYWVAGTGNLLTGRTTAAWAGRLFFVLAALAGLRIYRNLTNETAALLFLFTYGSLVYAPLAETDFLHVVGLILAFSGWNQDRGWQSGLGMAIAVLAKGPGGVAIPLLSFIFLSRRYARSPHFWLTSILPPLLAGGGWILYLQLDPVASAALAADLSATFMDTAHRNPLPYYVWTLPLVMLPAVFALPWARKPATDPEKRVALTWFWVTFVLLTLTVSKQRHYALMLLPPACWWLSLRLPGIHWKPRWLLPAAAAVAGLNLLVAHFSVDAKHAAFLSEARQVTRDAATLHVVGINSARFDVHLGRHVENTDSLLHAYRRAEPGDAVFVVQKKNAEAEASELPPPLLSADDENWIRRVYRAH